MKQGGRVKHGPQFILMGTSNPPVTPAHVKLHSESSRLRPQPEQLSFFFN